MKVKMGKDALRRYARTLYEMSHPAILTRELLQNAMDACDASGRPTEISVKAKKDTGTVEIQVIDNGIGMSADVLENAFLSLGVTTKVGGTGGFGIAAATVFGSLDWSVRTNNLFFNAAMEADDKDPQETEFVQGTTVTAVSEFKYAWEREILRLIYTSSVDISLEIAVSPGVTHKDEHAGVSSELELRPYKKEKAWEMRTCDPFDIPVVGTMSGYDVIRLDGKTQFLNKCYGRQVNAFVDIYPESRPGDEDYPLSLSREGLQGVVRDEVKMALEVLATDENSVRAKQKLDEFIEDGITRDQIFEGDFRFSVRGSSLPSEYFDQKATLEELVKDITREDLVEALVSVELTRVQDIRLQQLLDDDRQPEFVEELMKVVAPADIKRFVRVAGQLQAKRSLSYGGKRDTALLLYHYEKKEETAELHGAVVDLWEQILMVTIEPTEQFGIGVTSYPMYEATRSVQGSITFYVINPDRLLDYVYETPEELVIMVWKLATHEATHFPVSAHTERFMLTEFEISRRSLPLLLANMKELKKGARKVQKLKGDVK